MPAADDRMQESATQARLPIMGEGAVLVLLGIAAIVLPGLAAIAIAIMLGWLFLFSGVVGLLMTLGTRLPGHQWSRVSAVVALAAGVTLIVLPLRDGAAFMAVLGLFFLLDGMFSVLYALEHRHGRSRRWGWMLASGCFTLLLAAFILVRASASVALLGTLIGIDLAFAGIALLAIGAGFRIAV